jgi:hypothetical protein
MPFVKRDAQGRIASIHREQDSPDLHYLPKNHPEVTGFLAADKRSTDRPGVERPNTEGRGELMRSDFEMIRVYEDLTDILISKRIVLLTDFPPAAQEKLMRRKRLRSSLSPITEILAQSEEEQGLP